MKKIMKRKWFNLDVTILGLSVSGISAAKYLSSKAQTAQSAKKREATPEDKEKIAELQELGINVEMGGNKEETILNSDIIYYKSGDSSSF